jgi:hypothetical protein
MDVYLVPVGSSRYELYCEVAEDPEDSEEPSTPPRGLFRRLRDRFHARAVRPLRSRFRTMLTEAERERRQGRSSDDQKGWITYAKARAMRWIAESIAEQRLLWHLRGQTEACLFFPDDLDGSGAVRLLRAQLGRDFAKHRFWLIIDSLGLIASAALTLVPGPNVLAYYFAFRVVGHYLSLRGAGQGLKRTTWRTEQSAPLSELRRAIDMEPEARVRQVHDVALRLRLEHLASFFERAAMPAR